MYFFAAFEYLLFFLFSFISFTVPYNIYIVTFSNMFIYSVAVLSFMSWSCSILSYATYSLCLNSFSTHSFLSLFHKACSSFFTSFCVYSIFTSNYIGTWSLNMSLSFIVWWLCISTSLVDNVQSIKLNVAYSLFFLIQVNSSCLLFILSPYILYRFNIYLPPISVYPAWHQLLMCELKSPNIICSLF